MAPDLLNLHRSYMVKTKASYTEHTCASEASLCVCWVQRRACRVRHVSGERQCVGRGTAAASEFFYPVIRRFVRALLVRTCAVLRTTLRVACIMDIELRPR